MQLAACSGRALRLPFRHRVRAPQELPLRGYSCISPTISINCAARNLMMNPPGPLSKWLAAHGASPDLRELQSAASSCARSGTGWALSVGEDRCSLLRRLHRLIHTPSSPITPSQPIRARHGSVMHPWIPRGAAIARVPHSALVSGRAGQDAVPAFPHRLQPLLTPCRPSPRYLPNHRRLLIRHQK